MTEDKIKKWLNHRQKFPQQGCDLCTIGCESLILEALMELLLLMRKLELEQFLKAQRDKVKR